MSLPHALLTALLEHPCSGSELASRFDKSIGYFWHATHQQIYRELARSESAGWIESLPEQSTRGRMRAYRILPAGRKELKRWVAKQGDLPLLRDELMVRLWAEAAVGPTGLEKEIRRRLQLHQAQTDVYRGIEACEFADGPPSGREASLKHLVLQAGIRYEQYWIELLNEALRLLANPSERANKRR